MSLTLTEAVVGRKKATRPTGRIEMRADLGWIRRVERQAARLGLSLSAYMRQATSLRLEQDEASDPGVRKGKRGGEK
jgi:hypothetical protein